MAPSLAPIARRSLAQSVMDGLIAHLRAGGLQPGAALPPQPALARELGVSRPVLREALQGLAALGMVEIRPGRGCFVRASEPGPGSDDDPDILPDRYSHETAVEVLEARMVIEAELAAFAAERATPRDEAALEAILERLQHAVERGRGTSQVTSAFHQALAQAGHNAVLFRMARLLNRARLAQGLRVEQAMPDIAAHEFDSHRALLAAVRTRDPAIARAAMREHLEIAHGWEDRIDALRGAIAATDGGAAPG